MNIALPLDQMSIADKMRTMEDLWDDLCHHAEQVQSPAWHGELLAEREKGILVGEAAFEEWHTAKNKIRETLT